MSAQWSEAGSAVVQRHARTLARLDEIPGVEASAFSQFLPTGIDAPPIEFKIAGRDPRDNTFAASRTVSASYFRTLKIPILQGDTCANDPASPAYSSALVTRSFADRFFPSERPIGHELLALAGQTARIVGVVADVREGGLFKAPEPLIYWCTYNPYWPDPFFLVRTAPGRSVPMTAIRTALREIEPSRAVYAARSLSDVVAASLFQQRITGSVLALFAATGLAFAAMGLYGVLTQIVAAERREIGVRIALGAAPRHIVSSVVAQAGLMTGIGVVVGLAAAVGVSRIMASFVSGLAPRDPITLVAVAIVLLAIAALASFVPARRAATIDPMRVLRDS
jgi:putative ABC transport system permease protein